MSGVGIRNTSEAAVNAMHMYVALGVQVAALKEIERLVNELANQLSEAKMSKDFVESLRVASNQAAKAQTTAEAHRAEVEQLQHTLTAADLTAARGT